MGLAEFPNFDEAMRLRLAAATDRPAEEFDGICDRPTIGAVVDEWAQSLSASGIMPFVHILAERFADALELATRTEVDLHQATDLRRRGCPSETAKRILL